MQPDQRIGRELSIGEVISKTFEVYRRDFTKYFVLFAVVEVILGIVQAAAIRQFAFPVVPANPAPGQALSFLSALFRTVILFVAVFFVVALVFIPVAEGTAFKMASERIEKGQADLVASVRFAVSRLLWIWALAILFGVIVALGFIALVVPGVILAIMFCLALPVLVIENKGVLESMRRSRELVGHRWGKTFVTFLVLGVAVFVATEIVNVVSAPFGPARTLVIGLLAGLYEPVIPLALVTYYYSNVARLTPSLAGQMSTATTGARFCANCGAQLTSPVLFCPNCGARQPA